MTLPEAPPTPNGAPYTPPAAVGLIDGSAPSSTRGFRVVLDDDAVVSLDELVVTTQMLPDGTEFAHYGIVVEGWGEIEGAEVSTDTQRITGTRTMPGVTARTIDVQVLRTVPERWLPPAPGAVVSRATGRHRDIALFLDQMTRQLPVGLDLNNEPLYADFDFMNGTKGGHVSISGISGVATKTSYAMFLLYMLFETRHGRELLGPAGTGARALVFNVKGEDLLHLDRPNSAFAQHPDSAAQWEALGVGADQLRPFTDVRVHAPRAASADGTLTPTVHSREGADLIVYGWTPWDFIREGLLQYMISDEDDRNTQVGMLEQRCRLQLARWAHPYGTDGAVVLRDPGATVSYVFDRVVAEHRERVTQQRAGDVVIENFTDLVDFLSRKIETQDPEWVGQIAQGTQWAFLRRLYGQSPRIGQLISTGVARVDTEAGAAVTVVDISSLHDAAQRFVVGALLSRVFADKAGRGREPLRFIVLDELNKYAPAQGRSPIKDVLVDIAARGRSLGVLLIGAQQAAGDVDGNITRNAAVKVVGRLDAGETDSYRFLTPAVRERAARFLPGTMVVDQPLIPAPLPMRFPFPPYATNVAEAARPPAEVAQRGAEVAAQLVTEPDDPPPF